MTAKERKKRRKKLIIGSILLVVIVLVVGIKIAKGKKVPEIKTTKFKVGKVVERLTETGNIELLRTVEVKSKIAGTVTTILVKEGDVVREGQILCIIDPDPNQTLLLFQKRSGVDRTRIELERNKKELERMTELHKTALVSNKELEDADNAVKITQNAYNLASLELDIMEREIETTGKGAEERIVTSKVKAPISGVVTRRYIEEGVLVTSGISSMLAGTNLFQIGDPSAQIIKTNISEVDIGKVSVGFPVRIRLDAYPDTSFAGMIRHISPVGALQQGRNVVSFNTEVEIIDKDPRLMPGMSCDVDVIIAEVDSVLYLPREAIYEKREGSFEEGNETKKMLMYLKAKTDSTAAPKKKFVLFQKNEDPYKKFTEKEIELGIKSESRVQIIADYDTTMMVAADAEKFFKELEAKKKAEEDKKKKEENKASN